MLIEAKNDDNAKKFANFGPKSPSEKLTTEAAKHGYRPLQLLCDDDGFYHSFSQLLKQTLDIECSADTLRQQVENEKRENQKDYALFKAADNCPQFVHYIDIITMSRLKNVDIVILSCPTESALQYRKTIFLQIHASATLVFGYEMECYWPMVRDERITPTTQLAGSIWNWHSIRSGDKIAKNDQLSLVDVFGDDYKDDTTPYSMAYNFLANANIYLEMLWFKMNKVKSNHIKLVISKMAVERPIGIPKLKSIKTRAITD